MPLPGQTLKEIHRLRQQTKDLTTRIEQAPRQLKAQENAVAKADDALKQAHDAIKHLKVSIHEKEVSIKSVQNVIKKHEKQFDEAANKKEYDALKAEIAQEKQSITKLEDQILEAMADVEERTAKIPDMEKSLQKTKADFAQYQKDQGDRLARFEADRKKAFEELKGVEEHLPEDVLVVYQREVRSRGEDALSAVVNRSTCGACYTEITSQMFNDLSRGNFVLCKACGRILYLPE